MANLFSTDFNGPSYGRFPATEGQKYMDRLRADLLTMGQGLRRVGMGTNEIQILLPAGELSPEMMDELDGSSFLGIPVLVYADIDVPMVAMELKR